ncbi:MAG: glycosyltransferase family 9 protein [Candidatus Omnitrophica bacterium]|nr:glycosyltransferase family 9 protein [Candidatus Omnitrophota bacterium]
MTKSNFERVLIVHPFGIGDALFITPIIRALHESGTQKIDLVLGSRTRELFETNLYINQIFVVDRDRIRAQSGFQNFREVSALLRMLRGNQYNLLIDFSLARQYACFAFLFLNIPNRVGFSYKTRGIFLNQRIPLNEGFSRKHVVEYYLDLLDLISVPRSAGRLEIFLTSGDEREAEEILKETNSTRNTSYLVVAPGGGESWGKDARLKRWPNPYFFQLIQKIKEENAVSFEKVFILGGKSEWQLGESLMKFQPNQFHNLCGKTSLRGSAAILKHAQLLLANDGGLVHLASAVGTPTLALFGPVDPKVYGPYPPTAERIAVTSDGPECRPCYQRMRYNANCEHIHCLTELAPDFVFEKAKQADFFNASQNATRKP